MAMIVPYIVFLGVPSLKTCTFDGWWLFCNSSPTFWSLICLSPRGPLVVSSKSKKTNATNSIYMYIILLCNNPSIIQQQPSLKINQLPSKSLTYPPNLSRQQLGNDDFPAVLVGVPSHVAHEFIFCISGPWILGFRQVVLPLPMVDKH